MLEAESINAVFEKSCGVLFVSLVPVVPYVPRFRTMPGGFNHSFLLPRHFLKMIARRIPDVFVFVLRCGIKNRK